MLRRQAAAVGGADQRAFGDAQQRVLRLVVGGGGEIGLVGGDQRQALRIGEPDQRRLDPALALDLERGFRLKAAGYRIFAVSIPAEITPKNRLLLGDLGR